MWKGASRFLVDVEDGEVKIKAVDGGDAEMN
jgi:hypothetical protein